MHIGPGIAPGQRNALILAGGGGHCLKEETLEIASVTIESRLVVLAESDASRLPGVILGAKERRALGILLVHAHG